MEFLQSNDNQSWWQSLVKIKDIFFLILTGLNNEILVLY